MPASTPYVYIDDECHFLTSEWTNDDGEKIPCVDLGHSAIPGYRIIMLGTKRRVVVAGYRVEFVGMRPIDAPTHTTADRGDYVEVERRFTEDFWRVTTYEGPDGHRVIVGIPAQENLAFQRSWSEDRERSMLASLTSGHIGSRAGGSDD